jgi:hypothetical protein
MIVPGQTPEGEWPLVKILNFGAMAPTFSRTGFTTTGPGDLMQFASPEQLQGATADFRSDIYSLGATLWFLLTGAPPRAGMVQRSRGIPKNVAAVISRMLASNPEQRPVDPLVLQEDIRACLGRAERRDSIGRRFGLPAKVAKTDPIVAATVPLAVLPCGGSGGIGGVGRGRKRGGHDSRCCWTRKCRAFSPAAARVGGGIAHHRRDCGDDSARSGSHRAQLAGGEGAGSDRGEGWRSRRCCERRRRESRAAGSPGGGNACCGARSS